MAGVVVQPDSHIGDQVILNTGAMIDHDCIVADYAHAAPGCVLAGNVTVGEGSFLGVGVRALPGVWIGHWSIVGAGAVVNTSVPKNVTAVGVPARVVKEQEEGWHRVVGKVDGPPPPPTTKVTGL